MIIWGFHAYYFSFDSYNKILEAMYVFNCYIWSNNFLCKELMIIKFLNIQNWVAFLDKKKQNIQFFYSQFYIGLDLAIFKIETTQ